MVAEILRFYGSYDTVNYVYIMSKDNSLQIPIYNILHPKVGYKCWNVAIFLKSSFSYWMEYIFIQSVCIYIQSYS